MYRIITSQQDYNIMQLYIIYRTVTSIRIDNMYDDSRICNDGGGVR